MTFNGHFKSLLPCLLRSFISDSAWIWVSLLIVILSFCKFLGSVLLLDVLKVHIDVSRHRFFPFMLHPFILKALVFLYLWEIFSFFFFQFNFICFLCSFVLEVLVVRCFQCLGSFALCSESCLWLYLPDLYQNFYISAKILFLNWSEPILEIFLFHSSLFYFRTQHLLKSRDNWSFKKFSPIL